MVGGYWEAQNSSELMLSADHEMLPADRGVVADALQRVANAPQRPLAELMLALTDDKPSKRWKAADAVGKIGPEAAPALWVAMEVVLVKRELLKNRLCRYPLVLGIYFMSWLIKISY